MSKGLEEKEVEELIEYILNNQKATQYLRHDSSSFVEYFSKKDLLDKIESFRKQKKYVNLEDLAQEIIANHKQMPMQFSLILSYLVLLGERYSKTLEELCKKD